MLSKALKIMFIFLVVKPLVFVALGLNVINRNKLPQKGPVLIAANHNSHLDTLVLLALFPISLVHKVRPVAAADYFLSNRFSAWLSLNVIGIIPINRTGNAADRNALFNECHRALDKGDILLVFPEGSRGEPEVMSELKKGIYHLAREHDHCPVIPVVMKGLGMSLPKGTAMFVPFNCDVVIGQPVDHVDCSETFMAEIQAQYAELSQHCITQYNA
ncbi:MULTISPECIES: lysophospholipid acyltransferase family protein [Grimontia]|uniref:2-acyl-glycerophospho-ethanolamine acyltransferase n=1 Tax=Grimontia marina TaxID=646534 RepID=A0A128EUP3_9GAMM|nr:MULTISPECIES: lysophospholipid acyltransferase family protein [Grimontia]WRV99301.1 lysophospholipid acyltransferase family protein [Grimontia sp. NTOU-MAR1]CZF77910.1 2-acyl-glycerophospho-ethanolamine acyltransferase [Grimontia marina]